MKYALVVLFVLAVAAPVVGSELMTNDETPVRAKPKAKAAVLTTIAKNVRIPFEKRKGNWFLVTVDVDGKDVTGWVSRRHVTDLMGRSKGQLLAENKNLYNEVVELRKTTKQLRAELAEAKRKGEDSDTKLKAALGEIAQLKAVKKPDIKAAVKPAVKPEVKPEIKPDAGPEDRPK